MEYLLNLVRKQNKIFLAAAWFAFASILFFLPGSDLPENEVFTLIRLDKWVHIGLFLLLLYLWCRALQLQHFKSYLIILLIALLYGFLVEVIQGRFIPNRSYDLFDILADFTGSVAGVWLWKWHKKNRPL
jgi:VanZ family protein